jgi:hypothetical protein
MGEGSAHHAYKNSMRVAEPCVNFSSQHQRPLGHASRASVDVKHETVREKGKLGFAKLPRAVSSP